MAHLVEGKTRDLLSLLLDGVNLLAFYFSLLFLIRLTTHPYDAERRQPNRIEAIIGKSVSVSFVALWVFQMYRVSYIHHSYTDLPYYFKVPYYVITEWSEIASFGVYLLLGLISIAALKRSVLLRSVAGGVFSFLFLILSVVILF